MAVDDRGNVLSSTDPRGGAGAWKAVHVEGGSGRNSVPFVSVSCPTGSLCVAVDGAGNVVSSTDPTGRASAWRVLHVDNTRALQAVSCPTASLCVAVDYAGRVITSTDPAGGPGAWATSTVDRHPLRTLSCASATLCVAGDYSGNVVTSANPAGGAGAWSLARVDTATAQCTDPSGSHPCPSWLTSISCASRSLCVAGDQNTGAIVTSSDPTGGASAWTFTPGVANAPLSLSCPTVSLCVGGGVAGVVTSTDPTGGPSAWRTAPVGAVVPLTGMSCPSVSLCVASDDANRVLISTDPTAPGSVWSAAALPPTDYDGVWDITCTASSFCVGISGRDQILSSTDPAGGASAWTATALGRQSPTSRSSMAFPVRRCRCASPSTTGAMCSSPETPRAARRLGPGPATGPAPSPNPRPRRRRDFVPVCVPVRRGRRRRPRRTHNHVHDAGRPPSSVESHARQGIRHGGLDSVSCPSVSLCVASDPDDSSFLVSTHPARGAASWRKVTLSGFHPRFRPISVSCTTQSLCVALDEFSRRVIESADPSGGAASWSAAQIDLNDVPHGGGLSCNRSFCIVGEEDGAAVLGVPARRPTPAQLRKALRKQLVPSARAAALLLKRGGYRYSFRIPAPGRLTVSWSTARHGPARQRLRPILIATAKTYLSADTTDGLKLRVTHEGRRLLRRSAPLTVTADARFTTAQHTVIAKASFTLAA